MWIDSASKRVDQTLSPKAEIWRIGWAGKLGLHDAGCFLIRKKDFFKKNLYIRTLFHILPVKNKR